MDGGRRRARNEQEEYVPREKMRGQRPVDAFSSAINYIKMRPYMVHRRSFHVPPHEYHCKDLIPLNKTPFNPSTALCTQWAHMAPYPDMSRYERRGRRVFFSRLEWSPTGRKLLASTTTGEFVLYNGVSFSVELKTTAHEDNKPCRALAWGRLSDNVLSGDDGGIVKIWATNFNLAAEFDTNQRAVRDVCWAPGEMKFASAGQDGSILIFDTERAALTTSGSTAVYETKLEGHGGDVSGLHWHPQRAMLASASQDRSVRLWDPRQSQTDHTLAVLQGHNESIMCVRWHPQREWLFASAGKDSTIRLWDVRKLQEVSRFVGHTAEIHSLDWHPSHSDLIVSSGNEGLVAFWTLMPGVSEVTKWAAAIHNAHDQFANRVNSVNCARWSPSGNVLATCSAEINIWTRNKPGAVEEVRIDPAEEGEVVMPVSMTNLV